MEFALPSNFDSEEIECAIQIAEEMGVLYEKGGKVSIVRTCNCYAIIQNIFKAYIKTLKIDY